MSEQKELREQMAEEIRQHYKGILQSETIHNTVVWWDKWAERLLKEATDKRREMQETLDRVLERNRAGDADWQKMVATNMDMNRQVKNLEAQHEAEIQVNHDKHQIIEHLEAERDALNRIYREIKYEGRSPEDFDIAEDHIAETIRMPKPTNRPPKAYFFGFIMGCLVAGLVTWATMTAYQEIKKAKQPYLIVDFEERAQIITERLMREQGLKPDARDLRQPT